MKCIAATVHDGHTHTCLIEPAPHPADAEHVALCAAGLHRWTDPVNGGSTVDIDDVNSGNGEIRMPQRTWGDEPDAPKAAPVVEVSSRDGADVPEVAAVTRLLKVATDAGWEAWTTYARADVPGAARKPAHVKHTVCLRLVRGTERGYAIWYREDRAKFDTERGVDGVEVGTWKFGDAMIAGRSFPARALSARLGKPAGAHTEDVPGAPSAHTPTPDGGKGGGASITGSGSPANPVPPAPPIVPGTWGSLMSGDTVTGQDGRQYEVRVMEPAGTWIGSQLHEVRVTLHPQPDDERGPIHLTRPATERIHIAARGELAGVAAAAFDAGLTITPITEESTVDPFTSPAPAPAHLTRLEPPTGQYGWYKLPDPADLSRTRLDPHVTTIIKTFSNEGGLTDWKVAQVVRGLAKRPDLVAMAASLDPDRDKGKMREVIAQADAAAGSKSGANLGTAIDRFTERLDAGESIASMGVPTDLRPVVEAYAATLARYGLTVLPEYTQRTVLNTTEAYAGTWDRLVRDAHGRIRVLDVKTNKLNDKGELPDYHWLEWAQQFACYNHAEHLCSLDFTGYDPMPHIDQSAALVLHLPINGEPALYEVDTIKGWAAARASVRCRAMRTESRRGWSLKLEPPAQPSAITALIAAETAELPERDLVREAIDAATDPSGVLDAGRRARDAGAWTTEHEAYAIARYDVLTAATAPSVLALGALWDELHPAGRWTEAVNAAAAARWEALQPAPVAA